MNSREEKLQAIGRLMDTMDELRVKCPWDREQTFESLRNLTIEETYELAEAISDRNAVQIRSELGDLLLHIVFYSKIASESGEFDIKDVAETIVSKLVYRHPHVFGDTDVKNDPGLVKKNWEELKIREGNSSVLGGVPEALPAMIKANRIQEKVRAVGFDWEQNEQIWDKINEELGELKAEITGMNPEEIENEFGDLFFSVINAARLYGIDPETALEKTNRKFIKRFRYLEQKTLKKGILLKELSFGQMNEIWEEAKRQIE
ncbi:MAG: nucleoside triphosphate pyrophosphohydrolase [Bacteroidales bacterium]|nr:nucleoside triphosphate pyrophosphohydrolase [Bacteroidales bacterium]